jgi:hypothetical protein
MSGRPELQAVPDRALGEAAEPDEGREAVLDRDAVPVPDVVAELAVGGLAAVPITLNAAPRSPDSR